MSQGGINQGEQGPASASPPPAGAGPARPGGHGPAAGNRDPRGDTSANPGGAESDAIAPDLLEAVRQLGETGRAGLGAATEAAKAMRSLVTADISLARSAFGRSLAFSGMAVASGASAWMLLMGALVALLNGAAGFSWLVALLIPALLSLLVAGVAAWQAMRYFEHTRLQATRRQLARLGIGEMSDFMPPPDSVESARDAARAEPTTRPDGQQVKDRRGIDVTPP